MVGGPHGFVLAGEVRGAAWWTQVFKTGPGDGHFHPGRVAPDRVDGAINDRSGGSLLGVIVVIRRQHDIRIAGTGGG